MKRITFLFLALVYLSACEPQAEKEEKKGLEEEVKMESAKAEKKEPIIQTIEAAHKRNEFLAHKGVQFDIEMTFGGQKGLEGRITALTNSSKVRVDKEDGSSLIFDGKDVYISPAAALYPKARFDAMTWSYFFMAPYKLSDPGVKIEVLGDENAEGRSYHTARMTFAAETGDSPEDWYILYQNEETNLLYAMAYIVTLNRNVEEASQEPHAISYEDYQMVDGIPMATEWRFWNWSPEEGIEDQIGEVVISDIKFVDPTDKTFEVPLDHQLVLMEEK
ncbi:hypothetical protein E1171_05965 [Cytophagales bacterium RKSG123]|nr:hypothetical protein [Xanthovirga aplysinae]